MESDCYLGLWFLNNLGWSTFWFNYGLTDTRCINSELVHFIFKLIFECYPLKIKIIFSLGDLLTLKWIKCTKNEILSQITAIKYSLTRVHVDHEKSEKFSRKKFRLSLLVIFSMVTVLLDIYCIPETARHNLFLFPDNVFHNGASAQTISTTVEFPNHQHINLVFP